MRGLILGLLLAASLPARTKTLDIYFIDVEGGQATLIVSPSGEAMMVDAGWPGFNGRDAGRIASAAKQAGVKRIHQMVTTHYHTDHVGGVPQLAERLPILSFVDHGANTETGKNAEGLSSAYSAAVQKGQHVVVKPGDRIPLKGVDVQVLTARGERTSAGGTANPQCGSAERKGPDPSENARSLGMLVTFGKFRFIDLGDLTWEKEMELACPENRVGTVDVYLTTHHGLDTSNAPALVHALRPRVAIMNNGARKGGTPAAWKTVKASPGLEDLWQVHFAMAGGKETNVPDTFIANLEESCAGNYLKLSAREDGSFVVTNGRNKYTKTYAAGGAGR